MDDFLQAPRGAVSAALRGRRMRGGAGTDALAGGGASDPLTMDDLNALNALLGADDAAPMTPPAPAAPAPATAAPPAGDFPLPQGTSDWSKAKPTGEGGFSGNTIQERTARQVLGMFSDLPPEQQTEMERTIAQELLSTDATRKNQLYADMVTAANEILDNVDDTGTDWLAENFTGDNPLTMKLPFGLGNKMLNSNRQAFDMAKRMFIVGMLRPQSGATINYTQEEPPARATYFPTYGDDPATIQLKRQMRKSIQDSTMAQAGPLYKPQDLSKFLPPEYAGSKSIEGLGDDTDLSTVTDDELMKMFMGQ